MASFSMAHLRILRSRLNLFSVSTSPLTASNAVVSHSRSRCNCTHLAPEEVTRCRPRSRRHFSSTTRVNQGPLDHTTSSSGTATNASTKPTTPPTSTGSPSLSTLPSSTIDGGGPIRSRISGPLIQARKRLAVSSGTGIRVETPKISKYRVDCNTSKVIKRKKKPIVEPTEPKEQPAVINNAALKSTMESVKAQITSKTESKFKAEQKADRKAVAKLKKETRKLKSELHKQKGKAKAAQRAERDKTNSEAFAAAKAAKDKAKAEAAAASLQHRQVRQQYRGTAVAEREEPMMSQITESNVNLRPVYGSKSSLKAEHQAAVFTAGATVAAKLNKLTSEKGGKNILIDSKKALAGAAASEQSAPDISGERPQPRTAAKEPSLSSSQLQPLAPASRTGLAKLPRPPSFLESVSAIKDGDGLSLPPMTTATTSAPSASASKETNDDLSTMSTKQFVQQIRSTWPSQLPAKVRRTDYRTILDWSIHPTVLPGDFGNPLSLNTHPGEPLSYWSASQGSKVAAPSSTTTMASILSPLTSTRPANSPEPETAKPAVTSNQELEAMRTKSRRRTGFDALEETDDLDHRGRRLSRDHSIRERKPAASSKRSSTLWTPPPTRHQSFISPTSRGSESKQHPLPQVQSKKVSAEADVKENSPSPPSPPSLSAEAAATQTHKKTFSRHRRIGFDSLDEDTASVSRAKNNTRSKSSSGNRFSF